MHFFVGILLSVHFYVCTQTVEEKGESSSKAEVLFKQSGELVELAAKRSHRICNNKLIQEQA